VRNAISLLSMGFGQSDVEAALTAEILREPMCEGRGGVHGISAVFGYALKLHQPFLTSMPSPRYRYGSAIPR